MTFRLAKMDGKRRRVLRLALWVAGFVALWAILAGLIMPPIIRHVATTQLSEKLGSACTLEKVRFNPFTLRLSADKLRIPLPDGGEFFTLENFAVRISPAGIYRLAPVLSDLRLVKPHIEMRLREDGTLALGELGPATPPPKEETATEPADGDSNGIAEKNIFGIMLTDLEIVGGGLHFRDDIRQADHTVTDLNFFVPFTSTLKRHRERAITPYLEAVVNGRPLHVDGRLAPFAEQLHTEFDIRFDKLDLVDFQPYLQPFTTTTLHSGQFSSNLVLSMQQHADAGIRLGLGGSILLTDLDVRSPQGEEAFKLPGLSIELDGALNTDEGLILKKVKMQGPEIHLTLLENGQLDWQTWIKKSSDEKDKDSLPIHLELFELKDGKVLWQDRKVKGGFHAGAGQITITVSGLHLPGTDPASLRAGMTLNGGAPVTLEGTFSADPLKGDIKVTLDGLPVSDFQPYVAAGGVPVTVADGRLSIAGHIELGAGETAAGILFRDGETHLKNLSLLRNDTGKSFFGMEELALLNIGVDVTGQRFSAEQLLLKGPDLRLRQDRKGNNDLLQLRPASSARPADKTSAEPSPPWQTRLAALKLENGTVSFAIEGAKETGTAVIRNLTGSVTGYDSTSDKPLAIALGGREAQGGSFNIDGKAALSPLDLNLRVRSDKLNLKPFSALLNRSHPDLRLGAGTLTLALQTEMKEASGKNRLRVRGRAALESISLLDGKKEFAALRALRIGEIDLQPARQRYTTGKISLTRPRIKMVVAADGTNNLKRLFGGGAGNGTGKPAASAGTTGQSPAKAGPYLQVGGIVITDASVQILDENYQPAVSNRLDKLAMTVGAMNNGPDSLTDVAFSGELNGALLKGQGTMNPLHAGTMAELQAGLQGLNLQQLSPMSEKFIAYPLARGTFTLNSNVSIAEGKLDSRHKIRLDGLELGDKVDAPDAPDLPVKLGISLLQDAAGNIDLTLPVRGDLNDPEFSVGGLIFKVIANLLIKAVASPFMFLGGLLDGGGEGLEFIPFEPGDGRLLAANSQAIPAVADMLLSRPKINLVLIPGADEADRAMLADAYVTRRMQEIIYAGLSKQEQQNTRPQEIPVGPEVDADAYEKLLFKVYGEQPFDKPTNFLGLTRKLPPQEMMDAIRDHYPKDDNALRKLAMERGHQVREAFVALRPELADRISIKPAPIPSEGHRVTFGIE